MRRILAALLVGVLALVALIFLITQGGVVASTIQHGQGVISLILALLELVGIALGLAFVVFVLVQYAQYVHSRCFIFEGFSNASKLIDAEKVPLDIDMLAREELVYQFKNIYSRWNDYFGNVSNASIDELLMNEHYSNTSSSIDALLTNELSFEVASPEQNKDYDIMMHYELNEVIKYLKDAENSDFTELMDQIGELASKGVANVMGQAGEIAPKQVAPIIKFVEAVVPPRIIRATGHLQWRSDIPGRAGITFEFVDLSSQRNLMIRTIWRQPSETETNGTKPEAQPSSGFSPDDVVAANEVTANQKQATTPSDDEKSQATDRYIELLIPAMHWLALMYWEQRISSHIPRSRKTIHQSRLLYLLGAWYKASANRFRAYNSFFYQLAIEYFRKASNADSSWYSPELYLANLYNFKMQEEMNGQMRKKLLFEAMASYNKAYKRAVSTKWDIFTPHRIIIAKALTELFSDDFDQMDIAIKEVEQSKKEMDPASFDPRRADCATYLFNLAYWYVVAERKYPTYVSHATENAQRYAAYCLARSEELWVNISNGKEFQEICGEQGLHVLKDALAKQRKEVKFETLKGDDFKKAINDVLREVARKVQDWVVDEI